MLDRSCTAPFSPLQTLRSHVCLPSTGETESARLEPDLNQLVETWQSASEHHPLANAVAAHSRDTAYLLAGSRDKVLRVTLPNTLDECGFDYRADAAFPTAREAALEAQPEFESMTASMSPLQDCQYCSSTGRLGVIGSSGQGIVALGTDNLEWDSHWTFGSAGAQEGWAGIALNPSDREAFTTACFSTKSLVFYQGERCFLCLSLPC